MFEHSLESVSDEELDALYSFHCLKDLEILNSSEKGIVPRFCLSYGRNYIIEKIKRVLNGNGKRY